MTRTCGDAGGVTKDGRPCPTAANLGESGRCPFHDPDKTRLKAMGAKGGSTPGLSIEHLGELQTVEDAIRWTQLIGKALARRDITASESNGLMRIVSQFRANEDLRLRRDDLRDLERQVRELKRMKGRDDD
jgi:hypothetical protein